MPSIERVWASRVREICMHGLKRAEATGSHPSLRYSTGWNVPNSLPSLPYPCITKLLHSAADPILTPRTLLTIGRVLRIPVVK